MHITAHQIREELKACLAPLGIALAIVIVMPLVGIGLFMFRGVLATVVGISLALAVVHLCLVRHRTSKNGEHTDA
ncbi:MAG: hypothetical protein H6810_00175 [Phycisphaeraceae bacterium]|nr:MAG: hypothetical protein H6810_00175 [Phycisphaeraceae bacterium]